MERYYSVILAPYTLHHSRPMIFSLLCVPFGLLFGTARFSIGSWYPSKLVSTDQINQWDTKSRHRLYLFSSMSILGTLYGVPSIYRCAAADQSGWIWRRPLIMKLATAGVASIGNFSIANMMAYRSSHHLFDDLKSSIGFRKND